MARVAMEGVEGVHEASFSFDASVGAVTFDSLTVSLDDVIAAFEAATVFEASLRGEVP
ncbi:MAG: hypothetical protein AAF389_06530 [Gemmatimonadota bacterium]